MTQGSPWFWTLQLLRSPAAFAKSAWQHVREREPVEQAELKELLDESEEQFFARSAGLIRRGLLESFAKVFVATVSAQLTRYLLLRNDLAIPVRADALMQVLGVGILLWATLARQDTAVESIDTTTPHEQVDLHIFRVLYVVGTYILAFSLPFVDTLSS